ncbi:MAG TPA: DUF1302 family protein [Candidatus Binatia bacterium]|nr:DUF1302 family protein [Candidatus Binatia bacterium]
MKQRKLFAGGVVSLVCVGLSMLPVRTQAISLDPDGDMKLGVRTYVNARVGTERTDSTIVYDKSATKIYETRTFPLSEAGHLRQNRFFIEAELDHDLDRLVKEGAGPLELLNHLPFRVKNFKYHATFRGEGDGLYDWGPREYSTSSQYITPQDTTDPYAVTLSNNPVGYARPGISTCPIPESVRVPGRCARAADVASARHSVRKYGTDRERLFQGYVEGTVGDLFVRVGRQVWSWGETDGFRLLDQINPIDSSFGGFLISLDERRVPLDMLRTEYRIGDFGPFTEVAIQGYGAIDNKVAYSPGTPAGSPWTLPNLGSPSATTFSIQSTPHRTFSDIRGGGRLYWNMFDATFSLAHYYTYFDTPGLQIFVKAPEKGVLPFPLSTFSDGYSAHAYQSAPQVQVTGATTTFAIERLYSVVRSEFAYFKDEPRFRQSGIDPFIFAQTPGRAKTVTDPSTKELALTGGRQLGDSINYVLGFDVNQYIRFLNPYQTFFFSTQIFYKHLLDAVDGGQVFKAAPNVTEGEVLPVPAANVLSQARQLGAVEPRFIRQNTDQFLQTFFVTTSYRSGTVNPSFTFFYDWSGSFVYAPSIQFSRDPWRLSVGLNILDAGSLKGNSGVSLLRDRDNVVFQLEYAI